LHAIVSLSDPPKTEAEYRTLADAIYKKLGGAEVVDVKCKNPSRFSRTPNATRQNGNIQTLLGVRSRHSIKSIMAWADIKDLASAAPTRVDYSERRRVLKPHTALFLAAGAEDGKWNNTLFTAALDMFRAQYPEDEIFNLVFKIHGRLDKSDRETIKSAGRAAAKG
jgi:hypothetical protein